MALVTFPACLLPSSSSTIPPWPHRLHTGSCWSWNTSGLLPPHGFSLTVLSSGLTDIPVANSVICFKVLFSCHLLNETHLSPLLSFFQRTSNILVNLLYCIYRKLLAKMTHQGFQSDLFPDVYPQTCSKRQLDEQ